MCSSNICFLLLHINEFHPLWYLKPTSSFVFSWRMVFKVRTLAILESHCIFLGLFLVWSESESVICSVVSDSATPRTVADQVPLTMDSPSKNPGVGGHSLLQGIFLTQGSNPSLLHCRQILYHPSHWRRLLPNIHTIQVMWYVSCLSVSFSLLLRPARGI